MNCSSSGMVSKSRPFPIIENGEPLAGLLQVPIVVDRIGGLRPILRRKPNRVIGQCDKVGHYTHLKDSLAKWLMLDDPTYSNLRLSLDDLGDRYHGFTAVGALTRQLDTPLQLGDIAVDLTSETGWCELARMYRHLFHRPSGPILCCARSSNGDSNDQQEKRGRERGSFLCGTHGALFYGVAA